jgi:inner membrane protein
MPTILSHAIFASAVGGAFRARQVSTFPARFWTLSVACTILPDVDVVAFALGIPYSSMFGHRGVTHSLLFAIITGVFVSLLFFRTDNFSNWKLASYFAAVTFSHPILDMFTNGGLGVALFAPFSNERFFFPWRPIEVSPIGAGFFSERGLSVVISEMVWIWIPSLIITATVLFVRRKIKKRSGQKLPGRNIL